MGNPVKKVVDALNDGRDPSTGNVRDAMKMLKRLWLAASIDENPIEDLDIEVENCSPIGDLCDD